MKRRDLFKTLMGVAVCGGVASATPRKHGRLTVEGHRAHMNLTGENLRVFLDGVEVQGVYEADDVEGYALVFCQDPQNHRDWTAKGHKHIGGDYGGACKMRLTGNILIAP